MNNHCTYCKYCAAAAEVVFEKYCNKRCHLEAVGETQAGSNTIQAQGGDELIAEPDILLEQLEEGSFKHVISMVCLSNC